jgi:hypothetical protein
MFKKTRIWRFTERMAPSIYIKIDLKNELKATKEGKIANNAGK